MPAVERQGLTTESESKTLAQAYFDRKRPGWFTTHVFNRQTAALTGSGVSVAEVFLPRC
jgi:hypothetical protein